MATEAGRARWGTRQLASMALLCSISLLLSFIEFPIFPAAPFLKYDAGFVPVMITGFAYGAGSGVAVGLVQVVLHGLFLGDVPGSLMNALVVCCFVIPGSVIYRRKHNRTGAFVGLLVSGICSIVAAILGNLVITPFYMGVPLESVIAMIIPILLPFNILKALLNCLLTAFVYKATSNVIKPKHERTPAKVKALPAIVPLDPTETAVQVEDLHYSYDNKSEALAGVSLSVPKGQFVCILGGNGSGKSTLAKHINALLVPDSGTVRVFGVPTSDSTQTYRIRSSVGLVFQSPEDQLVASIVEDDVAFGPENLGLEPDEIRRRVDSALEAVNLQDQAQAEVSTLSGGQKQCVAIAGILAMNPQVLVLDEALSMLDPQGRMDVLGIVAKLRDRGMTILMVTHNLEEASLADRIVVLKDGKLIADGTPQEVLADKALTSEARLSYDLSQLRR